MIKFLARCRRRKGFTLVELIVVVAIIAVIMACVAAFSGPINTLIRNTNAKADATNINKIIGSYIENRLAYANHIDIYANVPYSNAYTAEKALIDGSFTTLKDRAAEAGKKNNPRIMIFHFEENTTNPVESTYKVYDIPVTASMAEPTDYTALCTAENALFTEDFYAGYQFFFNIDDMGVQTNLVKKRANLNMRIDSFHMTGDSVDRRVNKDESVIGLNKDHIDYYQKFLAKEAPYNATDTQNPLDDYAYEKTGTEGLSFALQNIIPETTVDSAHPDHMIVKVDGLKITRGATAGGTTFYDNDILIFYNVRTYDIANDT